MASNTPSPARGPLAPHEWDSEGPDPSADAIPTTPVTDAVIRADPFHARATVVREALFDTGDPSIVVSSGRQMSPAFAASSEHPPTAGSAMLVTSASGSVRVTDSQDTVEAVESIKRALENSVAHQSPFFPKAKLTVTAELPNERLVRNRGIMNQLQDSNADFERQRQQFRQAQRYMAQKAEETGGDDAEGASRHQRDYDDDASSTDPSTVLFGDSFTYNLEANAFFMLSPHNNFRRWLFFVVDNVTFERVIVFIIALNIITMVLDTPGIQSAPGVSTIVFASEIVFQTLFTAEMLMKMLALGVVLHKHSYLRSVWNMVDFLVVVFGFLAYELGPTFRVLRLGRVIRLLRAMSKVPQLKSIAVALANSGPRMADVGLLIVFVMATVAVLGLQLFVGDCNQFCYFYRNESTMVNVSILNTTTNSMVFVEQEQWKMVPFVDPLDGTVCTTSGYGHQCERGAVCKVHLDVKSVPYLNFDNFGTALLYTIKIMTADNWPTDTVIMQHGEGYAFFLFSFAIIVFGTFFCVNLSLAILSDEYEAAVDAQREEAARRELTLAELDAADIAQQDALEEQRDLDDDDDEDDPDAPKTGDDVIALPDEEIQELKQRHKSMFQVLRGFAKVVVLSQWFGRFIMLVTIVNAVALGCDHQDIDADFSYVLSQINFACSIIFIAEMCIKVFALLAKYFYDGFNVFDCLLTLYSIVDLIISSGGSGSGVSALRTFRLARVLRLLNSSKTLRQLMITVVDAAKSSSFLFLFFCLFILTCGIFCTTTMSWSVDYSVRPNHTTLLQSMLALFIMVSGENWAENAILAAVNTEQGWLTLLFFYTFYIIGNYILLNFVIVILISSFTQAADRLREEDREEAERVRAALAAVEEALDPFADIAPLTATSDPAAGAGPPSKINVDAMAPLGHGAGNAPAAVEGHDDPHEAASPSSSIFAPVDVMQLRHRPFPLQTLYTWFWALIGEPPTDDELRGRLQGDALGIFPPTSTVRFVCAKITTHPLFELFMTVVILYSCVVLGFDNPSWRDDARVQKMLDVNDGLLVALFGLEAIVRCVAWGVWSIEGAYLRDNWNRVDLLVLIVAFVSIFVSQLSPLRALRIFRLAAKIDSVRMTISALASALPGIVNVVMLIVFTFVVFGILGVQLFKGQMVTCTDSTISYRYNCTGQFNTTNTWFEMVNGSLVQHDDVVTAARVWQYDFWNFNHLGYGIMMLLYQTYNDGWSVALFRSMDAGDTDMAETYMGTPANGIFYVIFVMIGNFFLINLFVGSLIDSFSHERDVSVGKIDGDGNPLLSDEQDRWIRSYRVMSTTGLPPFVSPPGNCLREFCQWLYFADSDRLASRRSFDLFITAVIILNVILLCTTFATQPDYWTMTLYYCNLVFACVFTIEAAIKLIALLPYAYFAEPWNRFDFLMVPVAYISIFLGGPGTNAIRVLRVARVLRLVKRAKGLKKLFDSLLYALPQLLNVSLLIVLCLFVFGTTGTALFGDLLTTDSRFPLDPEYFNFKNALNSMVLLFQIATTETWEDVYRAAMMDPTVSDCSYAAGNCGTFVAIPFFLLFMFCMNNVCLGLFVFVIVDNYMEVNEMNDPRTQRLFARLSQFRTNWTILDRESSELMKWDSATLILRRVLREKIDLDADVEDAIDVKALRDDVANEESRALEEMDHSRRPGKSDGRAAGNAVDFFEYLRQKREAAFMRALRKMDIPVDSNGDVRYSDCVFALCRHEHGLDLSESMQAAKFLKLSKETDPLQFVESFKIHHALAVRKIVRLLKVRKTRRLMGEVERVRPSTADAPLHPCVPMTSDVTTMDEFSSSPIEKPRHDPASPLRVIDGAFDNSSSESDDRVQGQEQGQGRGQKDRQLAW